MRLLLVLICLLLSAPAAAAPFSADAYDSCMDRIAASDERLLAATPDTQAALQQQSIAVRSECAPQLEEWLTQPGLPAAYRQPIAESLTGVLAELTFMLADAGQCLQSRGWLKRWKTSPNFNENTSEFRKIKASVDKCGAEPETKIVQVPVPAPAPAVIVTAPAAPLPQEPRSRALRNWGYALLGVGVVSATSGYLYNAAGAEDRDAYDALNTACDATPASCDVDKVNALASSIDDAKTPLAAMYGLAGVALLTGATFVTLDLIDGSDTSSAQLFVSPSAVQVAVRW